MEEQPDSSNVKPAAPPGGPGCAQENTVRYEYETLMSEYRMASDRIQDHLDADEKGIELTFLVLAAVITASGVAVVQRTYALLLLLAVPFHVLTWAQIRRAIARFARGSYIKNVLVPRLNTIIQKTCTDHVRYGEPSSFVGWEGYMASWLQDRKTVEFILPLSSAGKIFLQISASIVLIGAYFFAMVSDPQYGGAGPYDQMLLILNGLVALATAFFLYVAFKHSRGPDDAQKKP